MKQKPKHIIISGGGTGGHLFPALAIADALQRRLPKCKILFVGALGKLEMERVPQAGYEIIGLPVAGIQRRLTLKNVAFFSRLWKSLRKAGAVISDFQPDVVVGVGGYASFPVLWKSSRKRIPTLLQEQNSYAGLTNKILGKTADRICVAYHKMERYFPANKIVFTGNPVRSHIHHIEKKREEAIDFFNLNPEKKTLLIVGGSLGAGTLNESVIKDAEKLKNNAYNVIWQTGKLYHENIRQSGFLKQYPQFRAMPFIDRMDLAFAVADVIVSRAGAGTISELCMVGKAVVLVPSPNVAEDHQTMNALALVEQNAALMVKDNKAVTDLMNQVLDLMQDEEKLKMLGQQIKKMETPNADELIVDELMTLMEPSL